MNASGRQAVASRAPARRRAVATAIAFIVACVTFVVVVSKGLDGPLVMDSVKLYSLANVAEEHGGRSVLHTPGFEGRWNRIVSMASFVLDVQLNDGVSARAFKVTNVAIHLVTAALAFFLARLLVRVTPFRESASTIALITSVLWLLSPANINVALYAIQRMAMLSMLFTIAGLLCYTASRLHEDTLRRRLYLGIAVLICLPLAVLSKENGILLIPLAFLVEIFFLHPNVPRFTSRQIAITAISGAGLALLLVVAFFPDLLDYRSRDFTLSERLLSQSRALVSYGWHLLVPFGADAGIYTDGFAVSRSLTTPLSTLFATIACLGAAAFCAALPDGRPRFLAFGLAFFLVGHAVESTVIPLELYFMHRNYLPGFGLYFALSSAIVLFLPKRSFAYVVIAFYCGAFVMTAASRSTTWSSRENMAVTAVRENPRSVRAWSNLAQLATESRQFDLAEHAIGQSIALSDSPARKVQRLFILCKSGRDIASDDVRTLIRNRDFGVANEVSQALDNVLRLYRNGECPQLPVPLLVSSLDTLAEQYGDEDLDPWTVDYYSVAFLYASGEKLSAHRRLQQRFAAGHAESGLYRLEILIDENRRDEARALLGRLQKALQENGGGEYRALLDEFEERLSKRPER